jgi:hypothetical protein
MPNETMTDNAMTDDSRHSNSLTLPLVSAAIGIVYLVAGLAGGQTAFAVTGAAVMFGLAGVLLLVRGRSETIKGLMDRRDERINTIDLQATAATGIVLVVAVLAAFIVEIARGNTGAPYLWLGCLGGVTYVVSLVVLRLRR